MRKGRPRRAYVRKSARFAAAPQAHARGHRVWEMITAAEGPEGRDAKWPHPDLLPSLPGDKPADGKTGDIDWDAELSKLLGEDGEDGENGNSEDTQA